MTDLQKIAKARNVLVPVFGKDVVWYARISKEEAKGFARQNKPDDRQYDFQLGNYGDLIIEAER